MITASMASAASTTTSLFERAPFAGLTPEATDATNAAGVYIAECEGLGIANVLARRGHRAALAERWREHFAMELPAGPQRIESGDLSMAGTGPGAWLAIQQHGANGFAASLRSTLAGTASVIDQSDGYGVLRLTGPKVRSTLEKLLPIDVHERVFPVGAVAGTVAAHIGTLLWRLDNNEQGQPAFEIAVPRSMALSFWHALTSCAGEFGLLRSPISAH